MRLSKNFVLHEMQCQCGCGFDGIHAELIAVLQDVADHFQGVVTVNSGCRCEVHNKNVGGSPNSQHLKGTAADIKVLYSPGEIDPSTVADYLEKKYSNTYGIGRYNTFTHIDVRKNKARWG